MHFLPYTRHFMMPLLYVQILIILFIFMGTGDAKRRTCLRGSVAQFRCSDDECIDSEWVCDGVYDCDGGSDEMNCLFKACQRDHYKCSNGIRIHDSQVCDEKIDCADGSDERNCEEDPDLEPCMQRARPGPCRGFFPRYYYNKKTGQCEEFIYGGCHGNENNFRTKEDCESTCLSGEN